MGPSRQEGLGQQVGEPRMRASSPRRSNRRSPGRGLSFPRPGTPRVGVPAPAASRTAASDRTTTSFTGTPAPSLDRCPDCERPATDRWCATCGRVIDGGPSSLADRAQRHLRRLAELGIDAKRHGPWCITRATGGWAVTERNSNTRQVCPCCRREEYRGSYCSGCGIPTGAGDWHPQPMTPARLAALAKGRQRRVHPGGNGPSCPDRPETAYRATSAEQLTLAASGGLVGPDGLSAAGFPPPAAASSSRLDPQLG
jgi:hypothetical protein